MPVLKLPGGDLPRLSRIAGIVFATLALAGCADQEPRVSHVKTAGPVMLSMSEDGAPQAIYVGASSYGDYLAGLIASSHKDLSAAADFMVRALESDPNNRELLIHTFILVSAEGRHAEAVRLARRVIEHQPEHGAANIVLAVDAVERGEVVAAGEILAGLPEQGLNRMSVPMLGAWLKLGQDDIDGGLDLLRPLADTRGLAALHSLHEALLNDVAGRSEAAETAYRAALETSSRPSLRLAWLAGNFFERTGKSESAAEVYNSYLGENGESTFFDAAFARVEQQAKPAPAIGDFRQGMAEALFNLASLFSQERLGEMALVHTHLALRIDPEFDIARLLLGEILQSQNRSNEAIETYRQVDPASPFAWSARVRIAETLDKQERSEEAIAELEALAAERPGDVGPLIEIGNILRAQEHFADAVEAYDRAFERMSDDRRRLWTFYYFRGIALERSGSWPRAESDFLKALELQPEQPYVMNYLAYSWVEQKKNLDQAKKMLVRAVELRPTDGFIVDSLGWVYYRLDEFEKAVTSLEKAVELRPQDPVINDHLGDAYWRVGRRQEARFQWRRALSLKPEQDQVPTIEAKIKRGLEDEPENI